jgi:XTP/dITP diphosphohydrolase
MTVILVDARRPTLVPIDALGLLTGDVQYTEELPIKVAWSLPSARASYGGSDDPAPVLLSSDASHPQVQSRLAAGEELISAGDPPPGERLIDAVAVMDRLRTDGPWESEQTHDSLRRYLLEETYELFDAIRAGDAAEMRDELGDVLLQVLFHARVAQEAPANPFDIDDVADALIRKLGNRLPAVLAGESISLEDQIAQWDSQKALEKAARASCVDEVPTAQPALALVQKLLDRVTAAGLPADLVPAALTSVTLTPGADAESSLRAVALEFMDTVRAAEQAVAVARGADVPAELGTAALGEVSEDEWREHWPT